VFVEWNPIEGRPYLAELLAGECSALPGLTTKRLVVAREYHAALTQNPHIPYLEYVAKNVGIRRASGTLVLATNTDVLLGRAVVETLAANRLRTGTVYRAARYDIKLGADQSRLQWDALEEPANQVRSRPIKPPLFTGGSGDFALADRGTFHALRGYNEVYRGVKIGIDHNFLVKVHGDGFPIADIGGPVYHINHVGSYRISKSLYRDTQATAPWGDSTWHSRSVVYNNPDNWGLADAPSRVLSDGSLLLEFDWRAVPPLVDLRGVVLPVRQAAERA
jgi:hypothetical protein